MKKKYNYNVITETINITLMGGDLATYTFFSVPLQVFLKSRSYDHLKTNYFKRSLSKRKRIEISDVTNRVRWRMSFASSRSTGPTDNKLPLLYVWVKKSDSKIVHRPIPFIGPYHSFQQDRSKFNYLPRVCASFKYCVFDIGNSI